MSTKIKEVLAVMWLVILLSSIVVVGMVMFASAWMNDPLFREFACVVGGLFGALGITWWAIATLDKRTFTPR